MGDPVWTESADFVSSELPGGRNDRGEKMPF